MNRSLRVILVEDSADDAALTLRELDRLGYAATCERVEDHEALLNLLSQDHWDLVISDWSMPSFSALAALAVVRERDPDLPFIILSGTIGEDTAVEALRAGANDFILKDKLARLGPAIERELREYASRAARSRAEAALRRSERRFARLSESGIIGVIITDTSGRIHEANDAFLRMVAYTREELVSGKIRLNELTAPESQHMNDLVLDQLMTRGVVAPEEKEYVLKDGSRIPVLMGAALLDPATGECISFILDRSEHARAQDSLRRAEEQLRQSQKMEAIGSLAAGIAHDFNNLLSVVLAYSNLLVDSLQHDTAALSDLYEVKRAGERAADLTHQLLAFSRQQVLQPRVIDLSDVVRGAERLLRPLLGEHIELTVIVARNVDRVRVDPGQMEQVLMNLAVNARDAMSSGGKLTVEIANVFLQEDHVIEHPEARTGPHVMLAVSDTGIGMDKKTLARIFDPFFTTKDRGKGTGLGLSTVFGIVKQSSGSIWVYSELGKGTTFKVYLPAVDRSTAAEPILSVAPSHDLRGDETILLVEDDQAVRTVVRAILSRQGYHVLEAQSAGDAIVISEQHPQAIHLLLTDVIMPRMSGPEVAGRVKAQRPAVKVLFMSGYTDGSIVHHGVLDSDVAFLQKPIFPDLLALRVRETLDAR